MQPALGPRCHSTLFFHQNKSCLYTVFCPLPNKGIFKVGLLCALQLELGHPAGTNSSGATLSGPLPMKPLSHRERCYAQKHAVFLLRNLERVRRRRHGCSKPAASTPSTPVPSGGSGVPNTPEPFNKAGKRNCCL